jgi:hypothetical protein
VRKLRQPAHAARVAGEFVPAHDAGAAKLVGQAIVSMIRSAGSRKESGGFGRAAGLRLFDAVAAGIVLPLRGHPECPLQ